MRGEAFCAGETFDADEKREYFCIGGKPHTV